MWQPTDRVQQHAPPSDEIRDLVLDVQKVRNPKVWFVFE